MLSDLLCASDKHDTNSVKHFNTFRFMTLTLLSSMLYGDLRPWLLNLDTKQLSKLLKPSNTKEAANLAILQTQVHALLDGYPELQKNICSVANSENLPISHLLFSSNMFNHTNAITQYYNIILIKVVLLLSNFITYQVSILENEIDKSYTIKQCLKDIRILAEQTNDEIKQRQYNADADSPNDLIHFVLFNLKQNLGILLFDIQERNASLLNDLETEENFVIHTLGDEYDNINKIIPTEYYHQFKSEQPSQSSSIAKSDNRAFNFGFKGDADNLKNLIAVLCTHKNLLDQDVTNQKDLLELLTTTNINQKNYIIRIGCNSNLFTYIVDCLKRTLPRFTYSNIQNCGYFLTASGKPIKQSLFSNSKSNNPISKQIKAEIDKIFEENKL